MRTVKTILTVALLAAALLAGVTALFWRSLLTPEQKLRYGLYESAADGFAERLRRDPESGGNLSDYTDALIANGNFGRALYLSGLYGAQCDGVDELRELLVECSKAMADGKAFDAAASGFAVARKEQPCYQCLLYLSGYQHALLGDWASAKNYFAKIEPRKLPAALRELHAYYLARCYRLAGTGEEKAKAEPLLRGLIDESQYLGLKAKARYNLAALYHGGASSGKVDPHAVMLQDLRLMQTKPARPSAVWAFQKALADDARAALDAGDAPGAWKLCAEALIAGRGASGAKAVLELALESLGKMDAGGRGALTLEPGLLRAIGEAGAAANLGGEAARTLSLLGKLKLDAEQRDDFLLALLDCYDSSGDAKLMQGLLTKANLLGASDSAMAELFYRYGARLEAMQQWNAALEHYRYCSKLGGERAGEALLGQYRVLKEVQEPLDLERAAALLRQVLIQYVGSPAGLKAAEELLPLLIWQGKGDSAQALAQTLTEQSPPPNASAEQIKDSVQSVQLGKFWLAYVAQRNGATAVGLDEIELRYFGYYEICAGARLPADMSGEPALDPQGESPAEYLAGMGLAAEARDWLADEALKPGAVELYCKQAFDGKVKPLAVAQAEATDLLESGAVVDCGETQLLRFVLAQACPTPHLDEAKQACGKAKVPPALLYAVVKKESGFREDAKSGVGAQGLMQIMPGTVRFLIDARGLPADYFERRLDPAVNLRLGAEYLASLRGEVGPLASFKGPDWAAEKIDDGFADPVLRAVLHAYNGGPAGYRKWRERYGQADALLFTELLPNEQNEGYVKKVWKYAHMYEQVLEQ